MRLLPFSAFASLTLATPAAAADLFGSAPPPILQGSTVIETGTNWYVRGDLGASFGQAPKLTLPALSSTSYWATATTNGGSNAGFAGDLGFGYRFNNFLRFDATWDYWAGPGRTRSFGIICPYAPLVPVANPATHAPAGYLYNPANTCTGSTNFRWHDNTFLANGYVDLGTYSGFTPYVGGGVGVNSASLEGSANFFNNATGGIYTADLTSRNLAPSVWVNSAGQPLSPQPGVLFAPQVWNRSISSTTYRFAWSLAAGIGFQINPSATLDIGYRYIDGGRSTLLINPQTGLTVKQNNTSQQILVGVRYLLQ